MTQENFQQTVFVLKDEMYRFAKKILMSADEAEDVVMDLMMKFWQKKEELAAFGNLKSYALKSVKNECLNRLKHHNVKMGFADLQIHQTELYQFENSLRAGLGCCPTSTGRPLLTRLSCKIADFPFTSARESS